MKEEGQKEREKEIERERAAKTEKEKAVKTMSARSRRQTRAGTVKEFNQLRFSPRTVRSRSPRSAAGGWTQNKTIKKNIHGRTRTDDFCIESPRESRQSFWFPECIPLCLDSGYESLIVFNFPLLRFM